MKLLPRPKLRPKPESARLTPAWGLALAAMTLIAPQTSQAQSQATVEAPASFVNSAMDGQLMYQLLIAELALTQGDASTAYQLLLEAARRTRDEGLFRRSTDVALQARAGDQALQATQSWRLIHPNSLEALRTQLQILLAMNRTQGLLEPLKELLSLTPSSERAALIAALPRFLQRAGESPQVARLMEDALKPYAASPATAVITRISLGRAWLEARDAERSWVLLQDAQNLAKTQAAMGTEPHPGLAFLALELMAKKPQAEAVVIDFLAQATAAQSVVRLAYVRALSSAQRYGHAIEQLQVLVRQQPEVAAPYLTLGALHIELKQSAEAEAALTRYVTLVGKPAKEGAAADGSTPEPGDDDEAEGEDPKRGLVQAWLMLSQVAEQRGDFKAAESWLARIDESSNALEVQTRRATILARQGRVDQARQIIRGLPEQKPGDARAKLLAEASMLREAKRWSDALAVLAETQQRFGEDPDLLYEQSMMAEKAQRLDEMEALLRKVIALKPDNAHAYNALGYSLADRNLRLPEAKKLIQRALELAPRDPFITDSMGWVEYRIGNLAEAQRLLRQAWASRPDTEIGAHLGEVLWQLGQRDEARSIWSEARRRDPGNEVLRETLSRLRVNW